MPPTQTSTMIEYRRLRAPARDGEALFDPPWDAAGEIVQENASLLRTAEVEIAGRPLRQLSAEARRLLLDDARRYVAQYRDLPQSSRHTPCAVPVRRADVDRTSTERILLAGHQPQLFHPGVLFKNFALSAWGERLGATAVNLVIDNDAAGAPSIRVPAGSPEDPVLESIPYDQPAPRAPYEERAIADVATFRVFGRRVEETVRPFVARPVVTQLWPYAEEALERSRNLGRCLAQARHRLEADWGLQTLELPLSQVCRTVPFAWFVAALLAEAPRFCDVHNQSLKEYRRVHRLRSRTHPVPDLASEGEWREAPLWVWSSGDPTRRRLFVRRPRRDEVELTDRRAWTLRVPLAESGDASSAVERLLQLEAEGVKLRTRALMTTLYARLFLGDLFLHGIGGAKYDQLTDSLIQRFFGLTPPAFDAVTATVLLPTSRPNVSEEDVRRVEQQLRELRFHPEQHLDSPPPEAAQYVEAKRRWIATDPPRGARRERHAGIEQANLALQPLTEARRRQLELEREELTEELRKSRLLGSREFSFCVFPQDYLAPLLNGLLPCKHDRQE